MMSLKGGLDVSHPSLEPLTGRRVDVWYRTVSSADDEWVTHDMRMLSVEERARATAFRRSNDRLSFLMGRVILRRLLAGYAQVDPCEVVIHTLSGGKPFVVAPHRASSIEFNLSHTPGLLVWAFSRGRAVGVDVEHIRRMRALDPPPADFFSPSERKRIAAAAGEERELQLAQHWTLKEAQVKALGTGLARDMTQCSFVVGPGGVLRAEHAGPTNPPAWDFHLLRPTPDHVAAVCVQRSPGEDPEIRVLSDLP